MRSSKMNWTGHWLLLLRHLPKHDVFPVSSTGIALAAHAVLDMVLRMGSAMHDR